MTSETKKCSVCKQVKLIADFCKDSSRPDGISYTCRQCYREYRKRHKAPKRKSTEVDLQKQRDRNKQRWAAMTPKQKLEYNARMRVYKAANSEKMRENHRIYRRSNPDKGAKYYAEYKQKRPEAVTAKDAVNNAIKEGKLPPVKMCACADCGGRARHYHHESYAPEHKLDVVPLCVSCHKKRHQKPPAGL